MNDSHDDRPPLVLAMQWVSQIMSIGVEMVLPALLGYWVDQWLETGLVFLLLGATAGLIGGTWHLIRLAQPPGPKQPGPKQPGPGQQGEQPPGDETSKS